MKYKIGIENISPEVLRDKYRELLTIQQISNTIVSDLDFEKITQQVVDSIVKNLKYLGGVLFLVEGDKIRSYNFSQTKIMSIATKPVANIFRELTTSAVKAENLVGRSIMENKIFESYDVSEFISPPVPVKTAKLMQKIARVKGIVVSPINVKSDTVGALMFVTPRKSFTDSEKEMLSVFANQTGIAIENARLYEKVTSFNKELKHKVDEATKEIQMQNQDLKILRKITDVITSTLDVHKVCEEIANNVTTRLNFIAGLIALVDGKKNEIYPVTVSRTSSAMLALKMVGRLEKYKVSVDDKQSLLSRAVREMKPQYTDNLADVLSPPLSNSITQRIQTMNKIKGIVVLPIIAQGRALGVLTIGMSKPIADITSQEKETLATLANQAGLAINNALLFERTEKFNVELKEKVESATKELRGANEKLTHLDKAKTEFISIASHQLRTPLSTIKGYLAMILGGDFGIISEEVGKTLTRVYNSNERLIDLVNNMLNVSRIEGGRIEFNPKPLQISLLVDDAIGELVQVSRDNNTQVIFKNPSRKTKEVLADKNLLHEILINLIDNAIKYSPNGIVKISLHGNRRNLEFRVKDNGIGLTDEDKKRLFKKFSRGHDSYKIYTGGSGLGLYLAKKLVEMHGGQIIAESKGKNKGSLFKFTIPYA